MAGELRRAGLVPAPPGAVHGGEVARFLGREGGSEAAALQLRARELRTTAQRERATRLAEALGTRALFRIECFDVSHTAGERPVAACVVWEDGMKRADYRRFHVSPAVAGDDFAAIEETA